MLVFDGVKKQWTIEDMKVSSEIAVQYSFVRQC